MRRKSRFEILIAISTALWVMTMPAMAVEASVSPETDPYGGANRSHSQLAKTNNLPFPEAQEQLWSLHVATTEVGQWHPDFPARYFGPNSLSSRSASSE